MKKLGILALLLSLGLFTFGCTQDNGAPAENGDATEEAAPNGDAQSDAAPATDEAPPEQG